jgi:hypothetical protein
MQLLRSYQQQTLPYCCLTLPVARQGGLVVQQLDLQPLQQLHL